MNSRGRSTSQTAAVIRLTTPIIYYICVENGVTKYANVEIPVSVEDGTTTIPFSLGVVSGLKSGTTYKVRLYTKDGSTEKNVGDAKNLTLQPYFRYWLADGTVKEAKEPTSYYTAGKTMDEDAKANAAAIDLRGINEDYIRMTTNTNCLFFLSSGQSLDSEFSNANKVLDGVANKITVNTAYPFYAPEAFTAQEATYSHTFANGNNNTGEGWETIVLPFTVNSVKNGTKNLKWFKSKDDQRCHFWLMEFTGADGESLTFNYATAFEANKPYIISVPGNKWGANWDLTNKQITFRGVNVEVPATVLEPVICGGKEFTPTFATISANGYIMNAKGTEFKKGEGTVNGYNAYFAAEGTANALRIVIEGEEATGIKAVDNSQLTNGNEPIFNLNGQRLEQKQRGVNIVGGRKIVVK